MATRVLILNRQLAFAVKIKQALEQTGLFDVHPFTKADAAFDFLREHPQDVALVDFTLPGRSGAKIVQQLRSIQSDLAIVISPRQPEGDVEALNLQGMIDAPFSARDVIPLLENAAYQESDAPPVHTRQLTEDKAPPKQPTPMQTRQLPEDPGIDQSRLTTSDLENEPPARQKFGETRRLEGELNNEPEAPAQTRNLDQPAAKPPPHSPAKTRNLDAEGKPTGGHTRSLSDEELGTPKFPPTRKLVEPPMPRPRNYGRTRKLEDDASQSEQFNTQQFDNPPPTPPEISSLDEVLKSFGYEPPVEQEDTPAVPMQDSDAVRQYLATTDRGEEGDSFDDILEAFDPDSIEASKKQTDEFRGLVRSLQGHESYTSLPDRQQQTMDFILTSGMDSVLQEIEKTKTDLMPLTLPEEKPKKKDKTKPTTFQKLAEDEPPLPTLEENGTVSDLLVGISDRGFRNVLSLLRGDEIEETGASSQVVPSRDMDEAFRDFFGTTSRPLAHDAPPRPPEHLAEETPSSASHAFNFDNFPAEPAPDEEATVAQVVLQTTLDESLLPAGFSVDRLISDIEDRLAAHRLNIRPLPSWDMDTTAFRAIIDHAEIREPSFLPEELPPGEFIPAEEQPTRASAAVREWLEGYGEEGNADYLEDTIASERVDVPKSPLDERLQPASDDLLSSIEAEGISGQVIEPRWIDDEPEAEPSGFDIYPEAENIPAAETKTNFGIDHMFDDMILPAEDAWGEPEPLPEEAAESHLDDFFSSVDAENEEAEAPVEPSWIAVRPLPDAPPEMPAAEPEWIDTSDVSWDSPPPDEEPKSDDAGTWVDVEPSGTPSFIEDMYSEEANAVESSGWTPPEGVRAAVEVEAVAQLTPEEAYIAQLALNLTQVSLELSSEGSILTRGSEIVAFAGHVSQDDALELRDVIHNDWDVGSEGARLRFINLPSSGKDYMLYSIRTVNDLVLSMVFAGTTPLRVIRQQGQRLIEALESIPEAAIEQAAAARPAPPEPVAITPVEPLPLVALDDYAYVWLLRDPEQRLSEAVSHAISAGLTTQLNEQRWRIQSLEVDENYVYLLAGVPGDTPPYQLISELQQRSAEIASTQDQNLTPQNLWADSYLVLTPGRAMSRDEIQEFIEFQRMM